MTNLWNNPGVPHKGWYQIDSTDGGDRIHTCQMCSKPDIRYLHIMAHPDHEELVVGSECAKKMAHNPTEIAETRLKFEKENTQRTHYVNTGWLQVNPDILGRDYKGFTIHIMTNNNKYMFAVNHSVRPWKFDDILAAKLDSFRYVKAKLSQ